jgi:acetyltransferase-like isoleucine patch superfamily enzyme
VYICDFDHVTSDIHLPIKDQGIVKSPVRIGPDTWLCTKVTVTKGTRIGRGAVIGANAVVTRDVARGAVVAGVPARELRRDPEPMRSYLREHTTNQVRGGELFQSGDQPG